MFVKQIGSDYYGVYADEDFSIWLGTAERIEGEWYFQARESFGGKWAFGQTLADAVEQAGVLEKVLKLKNVRDCVLKGGRKCRILQ